MRYVLLTVRYLSLIPLAWAAGLGTYLGVYTLTLGGPIGRGDLIAVAYWSLLVLGVCVPVVYLPCLFALRRLLGGWRPIVAFPLTAAALGVVPVVLIVLLWGSLRGLLSQEALLFYCLFAAAGIVVGWVVTWGAAFEEAKL